MKKTILVLTIMMAAAMLVTLFSCPAMAKVTGPCVNCHTMHNSQAGIDMATGGPNSTLLMNSCLGCHSHATAATYDIGGCTVPVVYTTGGIDFANTLAGGNFYWVKTDDAKGHNVHSDNSEGTLTTAPGKQGGQGCGSPNSCHDNIHGTNNAAFGLRQGCTKCHMVTLGDGAYGTMSGYHHADDSDNVVGSATGDTDGFYRFLVGKMVTSGHGVSGIEDDDWESETTEDHNQYLGAVGSGGLATNHTTTAFCSGCHGLFHTQQQSGAEWIRHPSDAVIPNSGEYSSISTTYNADVPVARTADTLSGYTSATDTVTAGSDMVMCLSCHVAHGSPYDDMLRWDYADMIAGDNSKSGGCFVCHTTKND